MHQQYDCQAKIIKFIKQKLLIITGVAIAWVILWKLNNFLFPTSQANDFIYWIFLPSGLRLFALLVFGLDAVAGLFIGRLMTSDDLPNMQDAICISLISALAPYIAYLIAKHSLNLHRSIKNISGQQLLLTTLIFAFISSLLHNAYFYLTRDNFVVGMNILTMFIGDYLGSIIVIFSAIIIMRSFDKEHS